IISKFHDYYDSAMGYGQDPNLIYHRKCVGQPIANWQWDSKVYDLLSCRAVYYMYVMDLAALGFCGRIYPVWIKHNFTLSEETLGADSKDSAWLELNDLIAQVQRCYDELVRQSRYPMHERSADV